MGINFNKIDNINKVYNSQKIESKKALKETSKTEGKRDEVQISKEAMDYQLVMKSVKAIKELPDTREDIMNPIKEKLDNGTYEVDSKNVAERIIASSFNVKI